MHNLMLTVMGALALFIHGGQACGGFFCSQAAPVDQASEQILFSVDKNEVTSHIRIQYSGPSELFSWILPLPTPPKLDVGSNSFFDLLEMSTRPTFVMREQDVGDQCEMYDPPIVAMASLAGGDGGDTEEENSGEVMVLEQGQVGPFDFVLLLALTGKAEPVVEWLNENKYDQPDGTADLLQSYAEYNFTFLALRMSKDKNSGDIQPLVVSYKFKDGIDALSCIPLKLTKVAAVEDMPVYVWVFAKTAKQRAVPVNFLEVQMDWKKFDWMNCASFRGCVPCDQYYRDTVSRTVDVADGHGFITEYSGNLEFAKSWFQQLENFDVKELEDESKVHKFLDKMLQLGVPRDSTTQEIIRKWVPKPDDASEGCKEDRDFYATWNIEKCIKDMPSGWKFNAKGMARDINNRVILPLQNAQKMVDSASHLTRLFTTISPSEMTSDPLFTFDKTLPDVSNRVEVNATIACPDNNKDLEIRFQMGEDTWDVSGSFKEDGCEFEYDPPLVDQAGGSGSNTGRRYEPKLFKRTGDPATSGVVPREEVTETLLELEQIAMKLMPDNEWSEIPDNSHFKDSGNPDDDDIDANSAFNSAPSLLTLLLGLLVLGIACF
eukprot:TRINITY_DN66046_c2_g4_i1.p1 TRINITY_DN66046_c2_g4~~TRINITY_DN66046_c2_g4_i1.p1  ORF type:complete len:604 (-),score=61.06 TRINITY_DN66046_c2_g4_i1:1753-3564(-)